ncbi:Metallo-dependent phosphatase [Hypoxylon cercidicola]|nr:Metallo-dependent phosphatase [Hypoxylon cercidicola]
MDSVRTSFLIISDTHGGDIPHADHLPVDVAIHCGNLTQESTIEEFRTALERIQDIQASLKIVIPGNHDFTMDVPSFQTTLKKASMTLDSPDVRSIYGDFGEAWQMFDSMKSQGIHILQEGTRQFELDNGALLSVYASPFTPSTQDGWGFNYSPGQRKFDMPLGVDVAITHGPPQGIMDYTHSNRKAGCPNLFRAVARAQPKLHCFGHITEGWGAKLVSWRDEVDEKSCRFTVAVDEDESTVIEKISTLSTTRFDTVSLAQRKLDKRNELEARGYAAASHCATDARPLQPGQTLFVNASIEGSVRDIPQNLPWVVEIDLPRK